MFYKRIINFLIITFLSRYSHGLFPYQGKYSIKEIYMPNEWNSVNDCPVRYYDFGIREFAAPVFGTPAYEREFAHMAAIGWTVDDGNIIWNCGGSLISENFVLTAGHCTTWEGKQPDVVRMGDLNLEIDTDNQNAQQLSISEVIRHPEYTSRYRYHDIALLRLNDSIKLHETVCPACLWNNSTVRFDYLEACGYGQTGYFEGKTPKLLKVTLSPVETKICSESHPIDRKLDIGLVEQQICAIDRNFKMDTCLGDSGGPLQIKLLGNARMNPFIIGITSFGKSCGTEIPGVYTRISSYIDWIESVTGIDTDPKVCAYKYNKYREYEPDIVGKRINGYETIDSTKKHFEIDAEKNHLYLADVGWSSMNENVDWLCKGSFITEEYVITSNTCVTLRSEIPDRVRHSSTKEFETKIKTAHFHPFSNTNSINEHNIALLQLETEIKFSKSLLPACLWNKPNIPKDMELNLFGVGSAQSHTIKTYGIPYDPNEKESLLVARSSPINYTYCSDFYKPDGIQINQESELCYGNPEYYVVPNTCQTAIGAPVERLTAPVDSYFSYLMGINSYGNDCGFGFPAVLTKVSKYIEWIDSVIFGKPTTENDKCRLPDRRNGICTKASSCTEIVKLVKEAKILMNDVICSFNDNRDPFICCPEEQIEDNYDLKACPEKHLNLRKKVSDEWYPEYLDVFAHIALIGKESEWVCYGSLISTKHVLTDFECMNPTLDHNSVLLGGDTDNKIFKISEVKSIPNSLSLIKLIGDVSFSSTILPACLWLDRTRIPFAPVFVPSTISTTLKINSIRSFQNQVCKTQFNKTSLLADQSCFNFPLKEFCVTKGSPIQWVQNHTKVLVPYVVGVVSHTEQYTCSENTNNKDKKDAYIFTRIAQNIDWIHQNL